MNQDTTHPTNAPTDAAVGRRTVAPAVDIYENSHGLMLVADLPGVAQDNLSLHIEDGTLTLFGRRAERVPAAEGEDGPKVIGGTSETFDFKRRFTVPDTTDVEAIDATLVDGVLTLRLPRVARAQPRRIAVKAG